MKNAARHAWVVLSFLAACKSPPRGDGQSAEPTVATRASESPLASSSASAFAGPGEAVGVLGAEAKRQIYFGIYTKAPAPAKLQEQRVAKVKQRFPALTFVTEATPGKSTVALLHPAIEDAPPPPRDRLEYFAKGLDDKAMTAAAVAKGVAMFIWEIDADPKHEVLRSALGLVTELATADAGFIWDDNSAEMFSLEAWKLRESSFEGDIPDVQRMFNIHYYETDGDRHRTVSLGLAKLGVPDFVIEDLPNVHANMGMMLINACAQLMVEGAVSDASGRFTVDFAAIKHKGLRERLQANVESGGTMRGDVWLVQAKREEGDPLNRLVELTFSGYPGQTAGERQAGAIEKIFGSLEGKPFGVKEDDPELAAVKKKVQAKLTSLAAMFQKGMPLGDTLLLKGPFATDNGSQEWMWLEVTSWKNGVVSGTLVNQPVAIKNLKLGAKVELREALVADYLLSKADGTTEGGESTKVLQKRH